MYQTRLNTTNLTKDQFTTSWSYLSDKNGVPCSGEIILFDDHIICESSHKEFILNILIELKKIGKVMLKTSVIIAGDIQYDLLEVLIRGRKQQIELELNSNKEVKDKFIGELTLLKLPQNSTDLLSDLMCLGEEIIIHKSEKLLENKMNNNLMKDFLVGGQAFGINKSPEYKKIHQSSFDLGIAPFYFFLLKSESKDKIDWTLTDQVVDWLVETNRPIKGHPLIWLHKYARPEWMIDLSFEELTEFLLEHVTLVVNRYKDRIKMWDILNELPAEDANGFDLTIEQLLELTDLISKHIKKLQPDAERILNFSEIFGAKSYVHEKPSIPPVEFLKLCQQKGIEYESIGLQFYMGMKKEFTCRELMDISQTVDQFLQFGKNIHFSELGWPSKFDVDPNCFFSADHPAVGGYWHRGWDEELQAEFLERIYTLFASKDNVKSITWWDLTDNGNHEDIGSRFIPFSGLTRRDYSPKPVLTQMQKFREKVRN